MCVCEWEGGRERERDRQTEAEAEAEAETETERQRADAGCWVHRTWLCDRHLTRVSNILVSVCLALCVRLQYVRACVRARVCVFTCA